MEVQRAPVWVLSALEGIVFQEVGGVTFQGQCWWRCLSPEEVGGLLQVRSVGSSCPQGSQRDSTAMERHQASQKEKLKLMFGIRNEGFQSMILSHFLQQIYGLFLILEDRALVWNL